MCHSDLRLLFLSLRVSLQSSGDLERMEEEGKGRFSLLLPIL